MMRWFIFFTFFFSMAHGQSYLPSSKSQCSSIDLRNEALGGVRNQKQVSWCYAFTAADMLTYTYNLPEKASAADVAINYNDSDLGNLIRSIRERLRLGESEVFMMPHQTGFNKVALDRAIKDGYCPERVFPSEFWTKMTRTSEGWKESRSDLRPAMIAIFELLKMKNLNLKNLPFWFHFKNIESPEDFLALIKSSTPENFYSKLRKEVCKYDRIKFERGHSSVMYLKDQLVFSVINSQLEKKRMVGMDYDARVLSDRNSRGIQISEMHTSSIVARKWNEATSECQFLVRDSHGSGCSRYDSSYECLGGQVWLNEAQVYQGLTSVVYLLHP